MATRTATERLSPDAFEAWVRDEADPQRNYEYHDGEIIEVVSNSDASELAVRVGTAIALFVKRNRLGRIKGADGGYVVNGQRYVPRVSFISFAKQPDNSRAAYYPVAPDLAVEVISDPANTTEQRALRAKLTHYALAGVLVWVVNPDDGVIEVFAPGQAVVQLGLDDTLTGGTVLPDFALAVRDVFGIEEE